MKTLILFTFAALAVVMVAAEDILKEEDLTLIQDEATFKELFTCLMDQDPCADKMVVYRDTLPKYFEDKCASCSPKEKELLEKLIKVVSDKYPKEFKELMEKFTPKAE